MNISDIIDSLQKNKEVFNSLLKDLTDEEYLWKADENSWCLLELISHLYDEEREDFRARVKHVAENPNEKAPPINPAAWVKERKYIENDYAELLTKFLAERDQSVSWLKTVDESLFENYYMHEKAGKLSSKKFLINWLAHDYLHIKQIMKIKCQYLSASWNDSLDYAGGI